MHWPHHRRAEGLAAPLGARTGEPHRSLATTQARPYRRILVAATAIPEHRAIEDQEPAYLPLTEPKALGAPLPRRSLRLGPYQFFCVDRLQRWDVQRVLRHHLFQPPVFIFQLAQLLHRAHVKPSVLCPPILTRGLRDAV